MDIAPEPAQPAEPDRPQNHVPAEPSPVGELPSEHEISDPVVSEVNEFSPSTASEKAKTDWCTMVKLRLRLAAMHTKETLSMQLLWTERK